MMKLGKEGLSLIKRFEGLHIRAYLCPAGIWTIGFGHTGSDVREGMEITEAKATELLVKDTSDAVLYLNNWMRRNLVPLNQNQFDALVSFIFNVGVGNFRSSTLAKKLIAKDPDAANELLRWNRAGGRVMPGLTRRRVTELELFSK